MDEIILGEVAKWIPSVIAFIFSNLITIILLIILCILLVTIIILVVKRHMTRGIVQEASKILRDAEMKIDTILTSERFRDLELGLATGKTGHRLRNMQQDGFALRQEAERLRRWIGEQRVPLFSLIGPFDEASRLRDESDHLVRRIEQYDRELHSIERMGDESRTRLHHVRERFRTCAEQIEKLKMSYSYALDEWNSRREEAEQLIKQAERSAAFDALQARRDAEAAERAVHALAVEADILVKDTKILHEMKERIKQRVEELRLGVEDRDEAAGQLDEVLRQIDAIIAAEEAKLSRGGRPELREAAANIEAIIEQAVDLR